MTPSLSLVTNCFNEQDNLRALFNCVAAVVDEIIVVDTGSTDQTRELARKLGAKVYNIGPLAHKCGCGAPIVCGPGYGDLRTLTHHMARTEWTLLLDGDERMLPHDAVKLRDFMRPEMDLVWLPRKHYRAWDMSICENDDLKIHPDWQSRLVRNDRKAYWTRRVHEMIGGVDTARELRDLSAPIVRHFGYLKTKERLDKIVEICNINWEADKEHAATYTLEKAAGTANGAGYWREKAEASYAGQP